MGRLVNDIRNYFLTESKVNILEFDKLLDNCL
jgi:hypothetical protein